MLTYTVVLTPEPDGSAVNVTVPAMPGVFTWGRTTQEALFSAADAIRLHLEGYLERGQPLPKDRKPATRREPGSEVAQIEVEMVGGSDSAEASHHVA
jgi:predicted RNase H-like HicB family nuclease